MSFLWALELCFKAFISFQNLIKHLWRTSHDKPKYKNDRHHFVDTKHDFEQLWIFSQTFAGAFVWRLFCLMTNNEFPVNGIKPPFSNENELMQLAISL